MSFWRHVANWARPIFGVQSNFKDISKEEREERDKSNAAEYKKRRLRYLLMITISHFKYFLH